jgi:hypothetical protein
LLVSLCAGLLAASFPQPGSAQDNVELRRREAMIACAEDRARFCGDVPPGRGRIIACMGFNADKLGQRCFQAMTAWGLAKANAIKACLPDAERLCPHLPPRGPRARICLLQNADRLSKAWRCHLGRGAVQWCVQGVPARRGKAVPACRQAAARICLLQNADKLSKACGDALDEEPSPGRR